GEQSAKADAGRDCACSVAGAGVNNAAWRVAYPAYQKSHCRARFGPPTAQKPEKGHKPTKNPFFGGS
ncbi:hypothetical protein ACVGWR_00330, partial [Enterobacter hormaechei]